MSTAALRRMLEPAVVEHRLEGKQLAALKKMLKSLMNHEDAWLFHDPVPVDDIPGYADVIKNPMDLSTVKKNLDKKVYQVVGDFLRDMTLIWENCREFNGVDHDYHGLADVLEVAFLDSFKEFAAPLAGLV